MKIEGSWGLIVITGGNATRFSGILAERRGTESMGLPQTFCWTRYGTEAGETIDEIIARKERERALNNGVFLWGIGNSLSSSIRLLLEREQAPKVVFSPIRSKPQRVDVAPEKVVRWTKAQTLEGFDCILPPASTVTSRYRIGGQHRYHFALVCSSPHELMFNQYGPRFAMRDLVNVASGRPVGLSQVTAVVRHHPSRGNDSGSARRYHAAMVVDLIAPYFLRLRLPEPLKTGTDEPFVLTA